MVHAYTILAGISLALSTFAVPLSGTDALAPRTNEARHSKSPESSTCGSPQGGNSSGKGKTPGHTRTKAVYFISNTAQNSVVALRVNANGSLSDGSFTATGGAGMSGVDAKGVAAEPDALFSQGAVKVAGNVSISS